MGSNGGAGIPDIAEIGFAVFIERCGNANHDGVHLCEMAVIYGCGKFLGPCCRNFPGGNAINIGLAVGKRFNLLRINIKAGHREILLSEQQGQRQPYITQADNSNPGSARFNPGTQIFGAGDRRDPGCGRH